jgi:hypothetical protein
MRSMNSALAISRKIGTDLEIVWVKDLKLNAWFTDIFQLPEYEGVRIYQPKFSLFTLPFTYRFPLYMGMIKYIFKLKYDRSFILNKSTPEIDINSINLNQKIFIAAFNDFYPAEFDNNFFKPADILQNQIDSLSNTFNDSTYGIHIRRTDNPLSINSSPTDLFEREMNQIIADDKNAKFFVASDSDAEKKRLINKYGDRILTLFCNTSRQSTEGMKNAVIDLYTLSRTKMILGSYWSSFSDIAAAIGNIPLKIIKREN